MEKSQASLTLQNRRPKTTLRGRQSSVFGFQYKANQSQTEPTIKTIAKYFQVVLFGFSFLIRLHILMILIGKNKLAFKTAKKSKRYLHNTNFFPLPFEKQTTSKNNFRFHYSVKNTFKKRSVAHVKSKWYKYSIIFYSIFIIKYMKKKKLYKWNPLDLGIIWVITYFLKPTITIIDWNIKQKKRLIYKKK
ncbi:hypothetical protein RFI_07808 [Reticulomyxa filosa]|uniref:Uncharacterized protein n=1 Tax=Reticulomyxa filosa TaxID=46433 RepID=X6NVK0_RETFI|nr:hypothetical protein RFI_07808 [Reticulomyxa filosa]|eukprot:ETO29312.1 hypothetical protein RFI_07808 [Reticulomyxa filosa]